MRVSRVGLCLMILAAVSIVSAHAAAPSSRPTKQELLKHKGVVERVLTENIIPFWYPQTLDREQGGYRLNHDRTGKWRGPGNKRLVTQARNVWFFSRLANSPFGKPDHLQAARHGYEFLRDRMWDKEFGGFFNEVDSAGTSVTMPEKHLYAQSFAIYALSEYAKASADPSARQMAQELFGLLEQRAHDKQFGGYREFFRRDWSLPPADATSFMGTPPDVKLYNTHLHLMEALSTYYAVTRDLVARERLIELIFVNSNSVVRKTIGGCTDRYRRDWTPLQGAQLDRISYGHDVENVWLLMEACETAAINDGPLHDLYRTLFDSALSYGYDKERGGFYYGGPFRQPADDRRKSWWVQSEALVSTLRMYQLTHERAYYDCFTNTLDWVVKQHVDWQGGDWFEMVSDDGTATGVKAGPWKAAYHNGRAMLECARLLDSLIQE